MHYAFIISGMDDKHFLRLFDVDWIISQVHLIVNWYFVQNQCSAFIYYLFSLILIKSGGTWPAALIIK